MLLLTDVTAFCIQRCVTEVIGLNSSPALGHVYPSSPWQPVITCLMCPLYRDMKQPAAYYPQTLNICSSVCRI